MIVLQIVQIGGIPIVTSKQFIVVAEVLRNKKLFEELQVGASQGIFEF